MAKTPEENGRTIRSVNIAFDIVEKLQTRNGAGVTELAQELDHSKSTIHSHLRTLENRNVIISEDGVYRLSATILNLAKHVRNQDINYNVTQNQIQKLADETGEIANFGVREHLGTAYLCKECGDRAVESASSIGTKQPIYSTALGKSILAYLPDEKQAEILEAIEFQPQTRNTITSRKKLRTELAEISEQGYGIDDEENVIGLRCVAAPVRDGDEVLGAISLAGPSSRFTKDRIHGNLSDTVKRAANVIELNTKFS